MVNVGTSHDTAEFAVEASGDGGEWTGGVGIRGLLAYSSARMREGATVAGVERGK